jgi:flagellar biosynthesis protein FlhF
MIIKSFAAPTIAAALKEIREEMGGNAVVLKTRVCSKQEAALTGNRVEVTACIDEMAVKHRRGKPRKFSGKAPSKAKPELPGASTASASDGEHKPYDPERIEETSNQTLGGHYSAEPFDGVDDRVEDVFQKLTRADVPVEIAHRISRETAEVLGESADATDAAFEILKYELQQITARNVPIEPGTRVVFVGPSGAGKTSVMAKVAAQLCIRFRQKTKLLSLDHMKLSAHDEVEAYADFLGVTVGSNKDAEEKTDQDAILLIDTPSICRDKIRREKLLERIESLSPDVVVLVFSVCSRADDLVGLLNCCQSLRPGFLIASHLDESDHWGGILAVAENLNLPVAFVTDSPGGVGALKPADPERIARHLLRMEDTVYDG